MEQDVKPKRRVRKAHVTYELRVTCDKTPEMNQQEFLNIVREALQVQGIRLEGSHVRVSVITRLERFQEI